MSSPTENRTLKAAVAALVLLSAGTGVYFLTRPKKKVEQALVVPSVSVPSRPSATAWPKSTVHVAAPPPPATTVDVKVATLGPRGFADVAQLAKSRGYFDAEGLKVEIERAKIATDLVSDLNNHKYGFGITFDFSIAFGAFGKPGFVLLAKVAHADRPITVYARKDKGIAGAADLRGKRVGVQPYPNSHYYLDLYLKRHGLRTEDVTVVEQTFEQVPAAIQRGDIDAVVDCIATLRGSGWNLAKTPGLDIVDLSEPAACPINLGLIASDQLVKDQPETVERFTRAIARATEMMNDEHDAALDAIAEGAAIEGQRARKLNDALSYGLSLDPSFVALLDAQSRWFFDTKRSKKGEADPVFEKLVYADALRKVLPVVVTLPR